MGGAAALGPGRTVGHAGLHSAGTFVGWLLARRNFRGKFLVEALVQLPMVLPPVVPGYFLLLLLGTQGPIGSWLLATFGIVIAFTWKGAVIASAVMAFPVDGAACAPRLPDDRHAARAGGDDAWRDAVARLPHHHVAVGISRHRRRRRAVLFAQPRRVRRDDGVRRQHSRRNADAAARDLQFHAMCRTARPPPCGSRCLSIVLAVVALAVSHWITRRAERLLGYLDHARRPCLA